MLENMLAYIISIYRIDLEHMGDTTWGGIVDALYLNHPGGITYSQVISAFDDAVTAVHRREEPDVEAFKRAMLAEFPEQPKRTVYLNKYFLGE